MKKFLSQNKRRIAIAVYSLLTAMALLFASYIVTNIGFSISGEADLIKKSNIVLNNLFDYNKGVPDSILFVNVGYDKQLADIYDNDGFHLGNIDITNRHSLYKFLDILSRRNDYKYIVLDVFFDGGLYTEDDSLLFAKIASMERIVIPSMRDEELVTDKGLQKKAALSDYTTTFFSGGHYKFELENNGSYSIPYRMYNDITGDKITPRGIFYYDSGKLCSKTLFSRAFIVPDGMYDKKGKRNYYNLGSDLLVDEGSLLKDNLLKEKYIFIGDMVLTDTHETVMGEMQGIVILANTFTSLMKRQHIIPFTVKIALLIIFFIFAYQIYSEKSLFMRIVEWRNKRGLDSFPTLGLILSYFTYSFTLSTTCLFFYYTYGVAYDIFITATLLQTIDYIIAHRSQIKRYASAIGRKGISLFKK